MKGAEMMKRSRWLSLILAAILIVTMLVPVSVFAEEDSEHEYTVILHANRKGKVLEDYNSDTETWTYTTELTKTKYGTADSSFWFEEPYSTGEGIDGYADYEDGYRFSGWSKSVSGSIIPFDEDGYILGSQLTPDGITHLYAQYKKTEYVVTLDAGKNGFAGTRSSYKSGKREIIKCQKDCYSYDINDSAEYRLCIPWSARPYSPAKYAFDGWYFDAAFKSAVPDAGFTVTKDVTLYAKYIDKSAVSKSQSEGAAAKAAATSYYNKAAKAAKKLKVSGAKASAAGKKKANVKWKANKKANGYQIQYSLKKNFKNAKTVNIKGAKKKIRKLKGMKKGKTYYIRIRTYQNVLGVNNTKVPVYGKWSKKMKVKVK